MPALLLAETMRMLAAETLWLVVLASSVLRSTECEVLHAVANNNELPWGAFFTGNR